MIKIFISCRNRLAIFCKCITALKKHSSIPHHIYVYDNLTNYKIPEHFMYMSMLYEKGLISQVTFTTKESTFKAFSKAVTSNLFLLQHSQDPNKDNYDFLVCLDNDIILTPEWDLKLKNAWDDVKKLKMNNIKIIGQHPGGIKEKVDLNEKFGGIPAVMGKLGGSGLWSFQSNFHKEVGLLNLSHLVDHDKKHDQLYWQLLDKSSNGKPYILGLRAKLGYHTGVHSGSVCNSLTRNRLNKNKLNMIKFEEQEKKIDSLTFNEFYKMISSDKTVENDW